MEPSRRSTPLPETRKIQAWAIVFGIAPQIDGNVKSWVPTRVVYLNGEEKKMLLEKNATTAVTVSAQ